MRIVSSCLLRITLRVQQNTNYPSSSQREDTQMVISSCRSSGVTAPVIRNQSVFITLCLTSAASWFQITNWRTVLCLYILLTILSHSRTALKLEVSMTWCSLARVAFLFLTRSFPCTFQRIGMCKPRRFLARSPELLPFLSVMYFFLPPSPPIILPSSLTSSCHLFLGLPLHLVVPKFIYRVSQEEFARLRESVPYVKVYRYNPKHVYPKLNGYGDNGQRSLKLWQLLLTYWLPNTY